jgi:TonB family protein
MKNFLLISCCTLCLEISLPAQEISSAPASPGPAETSPPEKPTDEKRLETLAQQTQPAVILVTVFDQSGKLLRTGTGFFISDSGRIITTWRTIEGAANAVAKTADDAIYYVSGVLASSTKLDLAILNAEAKKKVPYLLWSENAKPNVGTPVFVIGSALSGKEGAPLEATISSAGSDQNPNELRLTASATQFPPGAPVIDESGKVLGIVVMPAEKNATSSVVRPATAAKTVAAQIAANTTARWPAARPSPTPRARLVYTPKPTYPLEARFRDGVARTGRYRVSFDATGAAKNVQVVTSTGSDILDRAAINGLQQWKAEPGRSESFVIVPLTFQSR